MELHPPPKIILNTKFTAFCMFDYRVAESISEYHERPFPLFQHRLLKGLKHKIFPRNQFSESRLKSIRFIGIEAESMFAASSNGRFQHHIIPAKLAAQAAEQFHTV